MAINKCNFGHEFFPFFKKEKNKQKVVYSSKRLRKIKPKKSGGSGLPVTTGNHSFTGVAITTFLALLTVSKAVARSLPDKEDRYYDIALTFAKEIKDKELKKR